MMVLQFFEHESDSEPTGIAVVLPFDEADAVAKAISGLNLEALPHGGRSALVALHKVIEPMLPGAERHDA